MNRPQRKIRVIIYGKSLLLASVQTLLEELNTVEVLVLSPEAGGLDETCSSEIQRIQPDIILYDATSDGVEINLNLFFQFPKVRLIGLDGQDLSALVMQGQRHPVVMLSDLVEVILA